VVCSISGSPSGYGVSDGGVVLTGSSLAAVTWTAAGGLRAVNAGQAPRAVSAAGTTVVGGSDTDLWRWRDGPTHTGPGARERVPDGVEFDREMIGVTADGSKVIGEGSDTHVPWTRSPGQPAPTALTPPVGMLVHGSSPDGSVIVGGRALSGPAQGVIYRPGGVPTLVDPPTAPFGSLSFRAVSADNGAVVGADPYGERSGNAVRWTAAGGVRSPGAVGDVPTYSRAYDALAVSGDGGLVGGTRGGRRAFIPDAAHGVRDLRAALEADYGLSLSDRDFHIVRGISADGRWIVGDAGYRGPGSTDRRTAFAIHTPAPGAGSAGPGVVTATPPRRRRGRGPTRDAESSARSRATRP
jgi:hypothetical protein